MVSDGSGRARERWKEKRKDGHANTTEIRSISCDLIKGQLDDQIHSQLIANKRPTVINTINYLLNFADSPAMR